MNNITPRQQEAFPQVAVIRKGTPKIEMNKNGSKFFGLGTDLKDRFRFEFLPGTESVKDIFKTLHPPEYVKYDLTYRRPGTYATPDGFEMKTIRAIVPCRNILDSFQWANVVNNAGTQIAEANDEQYLWEKNPLNTREYFVKNGQPFKAWNNGDTITYDKQGKKIVLPFKTSIRMNLFLPELERWVYFTLKSVSYYDRLQMNAQLHGIQFWADTLNGGNAAGIPLLIYRREQSVTWNKPDGSAQQTKQWLINIEADPEWVKWATAQMSNHAFGMSAPKMLNAPIPEVPLIGAQNPADDGDFEDIEHDLGDQPEPEAPPVVVAALPRKTEPVRPYAPELFLEKFGALSQAMLERNVTCSDAERRVVASAIDGIFNGETTMRYEVCDWLTGKSSTKDMSPAQIHALLKTMGITSFNQAPSENSMTEIRAAHTEALRSNGQLGLTTIEGIPA